MVAGRGDGRGSWFNTESREGNSQRKKKTKPNTVESRKTANGAKCPRINFYYGTFKFDRAECLSLAAQKVNFVPLTVGEACDPSESGNGHVGHIPIHAEGEGVC